jgi:hypothetical protein
MSGTPNTNPGITDSKTFISEDFNTRFNRYRLSYILQNDILDSMRKRLDAPTVLCHYYKQLYHLYRFRNNWFDDKYFEDEMGTQYKRILKFWYFLDIATTHNWFEVQAKLTVLMGSKYYRNKLDLVRVNSYTYGKYPGVIYKSLLYSVPEPINKDFFLAAQREVLMCIPEEKLWFLPVLGINKIEQLDNYKLGKFFNES